MRRIVVVGASLAGVNAVESLRGLGFDGEVTLVGAESHPPYDRPPLSKEALRDGPFGAGSPLRPDGWYAEHGVTLRLGRPAVGLDPERRTLTLDGGQELGYDGLVVATGSRARSLPASCGPARVLRTLDDCHALRAELRPGRRLVIVGGGPIGLEVAATATALGLSVAVVELAPVPMARVFGDAVGAWLREHHRARGVDVHCGVGVDAVTAHGNARAVRLTDGTVLTADVLVAGVGAVPAVEWLRGSGLRLADGVVCDEYLRTSVPGVVAAGDVARWYNPLFGQELRVEHWTNAIEQGRYAAASLLGVVDGPLASMPYFWSDQFDAKLRFVGTADAAEQVHVVRSDEGGLVALFGRDQLLRGALCVNAPRQLAGYRQAVADRVAWSDVSSPASVSAE